MPRRLTSAEKRVAQARILGVPVPLIPGDVVMLTGSAEPWSPPQTGDPGPMELESVLRWLWRSRPSERRTAAWRQVLSGPTLWDGLLGVVIERQPAVDLWDPGPQYVLVAFGEDTRHITIGGYAWWCAITSVTLLDHLPRGHHLRLPPTGLWG